MSVRRAAVVLCALLLGGCASWSGPVFYTSEGHNNWLAPGTYRSTIEGKSSDFRWDGKQVTDLPSGKKEKEEGVLMMVPLSGTKLEAYIVQAQFDAHGKSASYGLAARIGDVWTIASPDCATTREIVLGAGGTMDGAAYGETATIADSFSFDELKGSSKGRRRGRHRPLRHVPQKYSAEVRRDGDPKNRHGSQACHFPTRESLEAAARRYLAERQLMGEKITRIGD